ncbi:hypothetical protein WR25_23472 isoform A [Diploscapter pachys]|uniref:Uncharacterized protein n=1 Tax=Diploscapter pachys TaxID=2018661 RepID=A0A2A2L9W8_9BILA|nr:hypothetical protein WR25_23472 isoform A [Diploscapter pachys]
MSNPQKMNWLEPSHMWTHEDEGLPVNPPMKGHDIDHVVDIDLHAPRTRNNDNLYKDNYDDNIQPNPTDNALDPAQPGIETILNPMLRVTDANFSYQPLQNDGIELNNSCRQLPPDLICYAHDISKTNPEHFMGVGGHETDPIQDGIKRIHDEIERHRYPDLPGPEVLSSLNSTMAPQREHAQVHSALAPGSLLQIQASNTADQIIRSLVSSFVQMQALKPMQVCPPNDLTPSISNQNSTTEQQPASPKYGRSLPPGGPRLIKVITDEEIDGLRKLKAKEDRRKRTENPDLNHKKDIRKANSRAHHERNLEEKTGLNSMKQRLEEVL